jgi:hypothetical protein
LERLTPLLGRLIYRSLFTRTERAMRLAEAEIRIVYAPLGKSDEVIRVYSKPGYDHVMIVVFEGGERVEIEVRA